MNYKKTGNNIILMAQLLILLNILTPLGFSIGSFLYILGLIIGLVFLWIDKYGNG